MAMDAQFHVLAVDDSIIDRKLIERLLKSSSFEVTVVDSGNKALEFLGLQEETNNDHHDTEINLIITDYCMPGITGYDLLKKIKESKNLKDIPVVIMSSENIPARINRCLEEGAEEFFVKPVQLADVDKLKPHITRCKSQERDYNINKRKRNDECVSPNKSRMKMTNNDHELPSFVLI